MKFRFFFLQFAILLFTSCAALWQQDVQLSQRWKSGCLVINDVYILYSYSLAPDRETAFTCAVDLALKRAERVLDIHYKDSERDDIIKKGFTNRYKSTIEKVEFINSSDGSDVECYIALSLGLDFSNPMHKKFASSFLSHSRHLSSQYKQAVSHFRNYEDTQAINKLLACAYYSDRYDVNLPNMDSAFFLKRALNMLSCIKIFVVESNDTSATLRVCRKERGRLIPISKAGVNASFESGNSYVYEFFTDSEGYVDIEPFFYDISESGRIVFSLICEDREMLDSNFTDKKSMNLFLSTLDSYNIQIYFEGKVIEDKIGFITSFQDLKGNELSTKTYDLLFMSLCANFKDLSKVEVPIPTLKSMDDIFNDKSLKGFKYIIATQSIVDDVQKRDGNAIVHTEGELYILDNQNKKVLLQNTNIESIAKSTTEELAMQAVVNEHYQKIARMCRNTLFQIEK